MLSVSCKNCGIVYRLDYLQNVELILNRYRTYGGSAKELEDVVFDVKWGCPICDYKNTLMLKYENGRYFIITELASTDNDEDTIYDEHVDNTFSVKLKTLIKEYERDLIDKELGLVKKNTPISTKTPIKRTKNIIIKDSVVIRSNIGDGESDV